MIHGVGICPRAIATDLTLVHTLPTTTALQAKAPFARHDHGRDYEEELRGKSRFGDPFAHLSAAAGSKASRPDVVALTERYNVEALEKSGDLSRQSDRGRTLVVIGSLPRAFGPDLDRHELLLVARTAGGRKPSQLYRDCPSNSNLLFTRVVGMDLA